MSSRSFSKNEVIFRQGDDAQEMFDIVSGSVGVYINYGQENETQLTVLKAGNFLGEMGLIENYPRSATAVAMEDGTKLQVIDDAEFSHILRISPNGFWKSCARSAPAFANAPRIIKRPARSVTK